MSEKQPKKKIKFDNVKEEARALMWEYRGVLGVGVFLTIINSLSGMVLPYMPKLLGDQVLTPHRPDKLPLVAMVAIIATLVSAGTSFLLSRVVSVAGQRAIKTMRETMQRHIVHLPVDYFDSTKSGVLISRIMTDPEGIRNLIGTGLVQMIGGLLKSVIAFIILMRMNWQLTSGTVVFLILFMLVISKAMQRLRPIFRQRGEISAEVTGRLAETLGGVRLVKTYVAEEREEGVFSVGVNRLFENIASTITGTSAVTAFSSLVIGAITVLVLIVGGKALLSGQMKVTDLFTYVMYVAAMVIPLAQIASISTQISEAFAGLDRIREIRSMATEDEQDANRENVEFVEGDVAFENVDFEYEADVPVLRDVTFHSPAGTTTALVGPSGAGKSTLIGLVMAFHRPQSGRITIDGRELNALKLRDYRRQLGVVMQDNFLFDGTIKENIAFSKPTATDEEIREAGRLAHCDEFVNRFEHGYDTVVGERGVKLSGGQRQRVAIARAVVANPRILLLDEATSSLDSESEAMIQDGLRSLRAGRTTFVIAHRLSTIQSADMILVMDDGRIVERGTHAELLRNNGLYRRLYERQQGLVRDLFINPGEDPVPTEAEDIRETAARVAARTAQRI